MGSTNELGSGVRGSTSCCVRTVGDWWAGEEGSLESATAYAPCSQGRSPVAFVGPATE